MHVALVNLTAGGLSGGYRKYLLTLTPRLAGSSRITRFDNYVPESAADEMTAEGVPGVQAFSTAEWLRGFPSLRNRLVSSRPDVVFIPTARWLNCKGLPTVCMVRNMEPLVRAFEGNSLGEMARNIVRAQLAHYACRRSTRVIAVSQFVADHIQRRWRISPSKVGVVYHGVTPPEPDKAVRPSALQAVDAPFLFTAGSIRPARGLADLVVALASRQLRDDHHVLVIGGGIDGGRNAYFRDIDGLAQRLGVAERIIWAGNLSPDEMAWCYQHAAVFVMTSQVEACPNTVLEALSHGCLSVSTDCAPMPEFFGDSAMYYRARDGADLARARDTMLKADDDHKQQRARRMLDMSAELTWARTVDRTVDELDRAIGAAR